jgi:hypothetical protein
MSLKGKSLYVLTPMYGGGLTLNYHNSFMQLGFLCRDLGIEFAWSNTWNESLISRARNRLSDTFLKESNADFACFIDADIGFDPRDILAMMELNKDILGVPCSKKSLRWDRIQVSIARRVIEWLTSTPKPSNVAVDALAYQFMQSGRQFSSEDLPRIGGDFVLNFPKMESNTKTIDLATPEPMKHVGTGLLLVKRGVFEKFMKVYPNRWYEPRADANALPGRIHDFFKVGVNEETREYDSEDYWFIHDCLAMGFQALLCPWVKTTHMGTTTFYGDMPAALACAGSIL